MGLRSIILALEQHISLIREDPSHAKSAGSIKFHLVAQEVYIICIEPASVIGATI